jgi:hypothetical protein
MRKKFAWSIEIDALEKNPVDDLSGLGEKLRADIVRSLIRNCYGYDATKSVTNEILLNSSIFIRFPTRKRALQVYKEIKSYLSAGFLHNIRLCRVKTKAHLPVRLD